MFLTANSTKTPRNAGDSNYLVLGWPGMAAPIVTNDPEFYGLNSAHIVKANLNLNETITLDEEKLNDEV